ncbi:RNA pseudouridine synthase [Patescibacteria group bacterium]|nr:MAG: RNA pseudouridine synthase [Patescibacteria group bacterium]
MPKQPYKIIAETADYLVVEKPAGLLTHSTAKREPDSLAELLAKKYPEMREVGDSPAERPGIAHRLDKEASGLLAAARTQKMFEHLKKQFQERTVEKEYIALVHGKVAKDVGEINFPIGRATNKERMAARPFTPPSPPHQKFWCGGEPSPSKGEGKMASTEFEVEKRFINFTLLRVKIHTGRMHQIRVHLLAYGNPLVGDPLYIKRKQKRKWDQALGRLFLHCVKLVFKDLNGAPRTFTSPLPLELENFLKKIK